jgi:hypothetical protein
VELHGSNHIPRGITHKIVNEAPRPLYDSRAFPVGSVGGDVVFFAEIEQVNQREVLKYLFHGRLLCCGFVVLASHPSGDRSPGADAGRWVNATDGEDGLLGATTHGHAGLGGLAGGEGNENGGAGFLWCRQGYFREEAAILGTGVAGVDLD